MNATTITNLQKKLMPKGDNTVWLIAIFLAFISVIEVYSASARDTYRTGNFWRPAAFHALYMSLGMLLAYCVSFIDYTRFRKFCPWLLLICVFMLLYLALGGGVTLNGGTRWISILGFNFQPSEVAKLALIGYVSSVLAAFKNEETGQVSMHGLLGIAVVGGFVCALIFKENLSTGGIIGLVLLFLCWVGKASLKHLSVATVVLIMATSGFFALLKYTPDNIIERIANVTGVDRLNTGHHRLNTESISPKDVDAYMAEGYNTQVTHAKLAVSSGGYFGKGPGQSVQRDFLPMAFSDFIYAIIIEEFGLFGGCVVLLLYLMLLYRALRIAIRCKNAFPAYLVMGLSLMLVFQAMINMSVTVGLLPVTGQPLPMLSRGGTSTIMTCIYFGLILSVSHTAKRRTDL